jgi:adenylosuccinate synthase
VLEDPHVILPREAIAMPLDILIGAQWGDEGKGRITDLLAAQADVVARYSGGDNAGHSVTVDGRLFKLHLIPSGILQIHARCVLGHGMVLNPVTLVEEIDSLASAGVEVSPQRLAVSLAAHLITPAHRALDGAEERARTGLALGTTGRGIGPAYADKASRLGLRAEAMQDPETFAALVRAHAERAARLLETFYKLPAPDPAEAARTYRDLALRLRPFLADTTALLEDALAAGKTILAEGAQGTLLDLDHGTYPYVTSSSATAGGALIGLGVGPRHVRRVIGVAKSFQTRVGAGPFPTELSGPTADLLRGSGSQPWDEFGTTTGRPRRVGWLDGVLLRYASRLNGLTDLAVTKLDILGQIPLLRLCAAYQRQGARHADLPGVPTRLEDFTPEYEEFSGWRQEVSAIREWASLPREARSYLERIEALLGVPIRWISVGPERSQIVVRQAVA